MELNIDLICYARHGFCSLSVDRKLIYFKPPYSFIPSDLFVIDESFQKATKLTFQYQLKETRLPLLLFVS